MGFMIGNGKIARLPRAIRDGLCGVRRHDAAFFDATCPPSAVLLRRTGRVESKRRHVCAVHVKTRGTLPVYGTLNAK